MTVISLPARLDLCTVDELATAIRAGLGGAVTLDAGEVSHIGGIGLQLLLSAAKTARASGQVLSITPRSEAFDRALALYGVDPADLQSTEAA